MRYKVAGSLGASLARGAGIGTYALDIPEIGGELEHARKASSTGPSKERRLALAEYHTGRPFYGTLKQYQKEAPSGPWQTLGGYASGLAASVPGMLMANPWVGLPLSIGGWIAGEALGRKAFSPFDKRIQKRREREAAMIDSIKEQRMS